MKPMDASAYMYLKRHTAKIGVKELERITRISDTYLYQLERGERDWKKCTIELLESLARGLQADPDELIAAIRGQLYQLEDGRLVIAR